MNRPALSFYLAEFRGRRAKLALGVALAILRSLVLLPVPLLVAVAIDQAIGQGRTSLLAAVGAGIVALTISSGLVGVAASAVLAEVTMGAQAELRRAAVAALLRMARARYHGTEDSVLHDHVLQETRRIEQGTEALLQDFLPSVVLVVGVTFVLVAMNPILTAVTLAFVPVIYLASHRLGRVVDERIDRDNANFERFSRSILSMLRAMDLIRIQGAEAVEQARQDAAIDALRETSRRRSVGIAIWIATQQNLVALAGLSVLIVGGLLTIEGAMSLGDLIAFYAAFALLRGPLSLLADRMPFVLEGARSLDHLHGLLTSIEERPYRGSRSLAFTGRVQLDGVWFGYDETPVLEDVDLLLEPGVVTGLVGPNGSGKSTIVNLIVGFYRPHKGTLRADGIPYEEVDIVGLRHQMGVVPQQPLLHGGTVFENVAYGRDGLGVEDVEAALELAEAAEFVAQLPDGLHTPIGEDGVFLSGGQRQRLAIARAIVHRPPLLILDEPTNHLDRHTIGVVVDRLRDLPHRPAILLVSHRTEVLDAMDVRIDLLDGRIQR